MNSPTPLPPSVQEQRTLDRHRSKVLRERGMQYIGIGLLLGGYAVLAVSPDTPSEWVLLRVALGFILLFAGFGLAVMPWLSRVSRGGD